MFEELWGDGVTGVEAVGMGERGVGCFGTTCVETYSIGRDDLVFPMASGMGALFAAAMVGRESCF